MLLLHPSSPYHYLILTSRRAIITMWLKNENIVTFASCRPHGAVIDTTSLLDALVLAFAYLCHASQGNTIIVWLETKNTMMHVYRACLDFTATRLIQHSSSCKQFCLGAGGVPHIAF
jgi:hypothetical protein